MKQIADQVSVLRNDLADLEQTLPNWSDGAGSSLGGPRYRAIAKRIVESARRLEALVKENTFPTNRSGV